MIASLLLLFQIDQRHCKLHSNLFMVFITHIFNILWTPKDSVEKSNYYIKRSVKLHNHVSLGSTSNQSDVWDKLMTLKLVSFLHYVMFEASPTKFWLHLFFYYSKSINVIASCIAIYSWSSLLTSSIYFGLPKIQ